MKKILAIIGIVLAALYIPVLSMPGGGGKTASAPDKAHKITSTFQPTDDFNPGEPVPYYGKKGLLHQLVFLDLPGNNVPLSPKDYGDWMVIFGMIVILILVLSLAVRTQAIATGYRAKQSARARSKGKMPAGQS
jgi:hypothetical protein